MIGRALRRAANAVAALLPHLLPPRRRDWAAAMQAEIASVPQGGAALRFALGCLIAAAGVAARNARNGETTMADGTGWRLALAIGCGGGATLLGIGYLALAHAPAGHLAVQSGALAIGTAAALAGWRAGAWPRTAIGATALALGAGLLAVALFGVASEGASRWIAVGPLAVQLSLILLPAIVLLFVRQPDGVTLGGVLAAASALALQPDRGTAGALALAMALVVLARRDGWALAALAGAAAGLVATLLQPDTLPARPFVDRILYTAFAAHPLGGVAVWLGTALLLVPGVALALGSARGRAAGLGFAGLWSGLVLAAALGNYPTPLVGYGGSAVLGYLLALPLLAGPRRAAGRTSGEIAARREPAGLARVAG